MCNIMLGTDPFQPIGAAASGSDYGALCAYFNLLSIVYGIHTLADAFLKN